MKPNASCKYCHGNGVVTDWVDYGSTRVPMETGCDCTSGDYPEIERCSRCKEEAYFNLSEEFEWLSECCSAMATNVPE